MGLMSKASAGIAAHASTSSGTSNASKTPFERMLEMREGKAHNPLKWRNSPCTKLSQSDLFEQLILVVILLNSVWIGVDLEMNKEGSLYIAFDSFEVFSFVENIFCIVFSFEIVVRFFAYTNPIYYFIDPEMWHWNIFDFVLVSMMVVELWVFSTPMAPFDLDKHRNPTGDSGGEEMGSLASFRLLRLLRISRMVRVLRMVPELGMMVKSMVAATRGVASTMVLATGVLYVYSVIFTQWAQGHESDNMRTRFGNLGAAFMSFIQVMVYDDAFSVIRETFKVSPGMGFLLLLFIVIGSFTVLNMLIGVIVEIVQDTQAREQDTMLLQKIASVFDKIDQDGNGKLSRYEFQASLATLESVGVPSETCALAIDFLEDEEVDLNEFVDLIFKLLRPIEAQDVIQISAILGKLCESQGLAGGPVVKSMDMDDDNKLAMLTGEVGAEVSVPESMIPVSTFGDQTTISAWVSDDEGKKKKKKKKDESGEQLADQELLKEKGLCQYLVRQTWFANIILFVICLNAMWIGVDLEANDPDKDWGNGLLGVKEGSSFYNRLLHGMSPFGLVENIFCIIFTFEIVMRLFGYKKMRYFLADPLMKWWNIFDLVLVSLMIFENWVIPVMALDNANVKIFSIFRLLRLLRISRIIRTSPELSTMVKSLTAAGRSVGSTMALLIGLIYVFAIIMTQWGQKQAASGPDDNWDTKEELFGSIQISSLTLLQMLVFDDSFSIVRHILALSYGMGLLTIFFMIGGAFTVLNMLIGVICEIVSATKKSEEERIMKIRVKDLFSQFDADLSGTITRDEYEGRRDLIEKIGLDPETCRIAFDLSDSDGTGALQLNEFMTMCFKLTKAPEAHDVLMIKKNLKRLAQKLGATKALELGNIQKQHTMGAPTPDPRIANPMPVGVIEQASKGEYKKKKKEKTMADGDLPGVMVVASQRSKESKSGKKKK